MQPLLSSRNNDAVKAACKLRDDSRTRAEQGLFFAEGAKLCLELCRSCRLHTLYATPLALRRTPALASQREQTVPITDSVAQKLAGTKASQGVFGIFFTPQAADAVPQGARRVLALDSVQDPGNVGTLLRSAAAFGFDAVVLGSGCAAPFSPKALRSSMGAAARLPLVYALDLPAVLQDLRAHGMRCFGAALRDAVLLQTVSGPFPGGLCVVIGSEGKGLSQSVLQACDTVVRIPMTDRVESLNAGAAGSVIMWHFCAVGLADGEA